MKNEEKFEYSSIEQLIEATGLTQQFVLLFVILSCGAFAEGFIYITSVLVSPLVEKQFKVSSVLKGFFLSTYFAGLICSAFLVTTLNSKGRKLALISGNLICLSGSLLFLVGSNIFFTSASNYLLGLGLGVVIITGTSLASEICSRAYRTFIFTWIWIFFPVGEISTCFLSDYYQIFTSDPSVWSQLVKFYPILVFF